MRLFMSKENNHIGAGNGRVDSAKIASQKNNEMENLMKFREFSSCFRCSISRWLASNLSGAKAVIQPGGSMKDDEVIMAANDAGISMVFTGIRHFRH